MHGKPYSYKEQFVIKWANYVISNENWSNLQANFINAQVRNSKNIKLTKEQVKKIKDLVSL